MKIAVFGGSFNPIHFGHLQAVKEVLASGIVKEVWIIPCYKHAFKPEKALAPFDERLEMIRLAIEKEKKIKVFDIEKKLKIKYSIDLLKNLGKKFPVHEFFFVIGSDLSKEFSDWKNPGKIIGLAKIIVLESPFSAVLETEFINKKNCIFLKQKKFFKISAKAIRHNIAKGKSVEGMLPEKVRKYIVEKGLYEKWF